MNSRSYSKKIFAWTAAALVTLTTCANAAVVGWDTEHRSSDNTWWVGTAEPNEHYSFGGADWARFEVSSEDWLIDSGVPFTIAMPANDSYEFDLECATDENGATLSYFTLDFEGLDANGNPQTSFMIIDLEEVSDCPPNLAALAQFIRLQPGVRVTGIVPMADPHLVGYVEGRVTEEMWSIEAEVTLTARLYLGHNGEMYTVASSLTDPALLSHFFDSMKVW